MPPKIKITKEDIVNAAVELVRSGGPCAVNARALAAKLNCSTQPIFSNFATMEELENAVIAAAHERYLSRLDAEAAQGLYPPYKAFGMAYVRFAREEKELFRLLFMRDRSGCDVSASVDFEKSVGMIAAANGISRERAELMHLEMWTCVHGIGTMLATSFLSLDEQLISNMLTDLYQGLRARNLSKELENGCNKD